MIQHPTKMKIMLAVVAMMAVMVAAAVPAFAQELAEEIAVTGVVGAEGTKADGTLVYGIKDETTLERSGISRKGT